MEQFFPSLVVATVEVVSNLFCIRKVGWCNYFVLVAKCISQCNFKIQSVL